MNSLPSRRNKTNYLAAIAAGLIATAGCQQFANPWVDELAGQPPTTTSSVEGVRSAAKQEVAAGKRSHAAVELLPKEGGVTHSPLFFEDSTIRSGSDDGRFAWTLEDYAHFVVGPVRFLWRTAMYPLQATMTPPWELVRSDGDSASVAP